MKRIFFVVFIVAVLVLTGCTKSGTNKTASPTSTTANTPAQTPASTTAPATTQSPMATPTTPPTGTILSTPAITISSPEMEPVMFLPQLNFELADLIGTKVWVAGFFGDGNFTGDGVGFLVDNYNRLMVDEQLPRESFARLDGGLPPSDMNSAGIMVYGEIKDFGQTYKAFTLWPTPLISVEKYEVIDSPSILPNWEDSFQLASSNEFSYTTNAPETTASDKLSGTQASDCDRSLILSGGVDANNNHARYRDNVKAKFKKMKELGFTDDHISVLYNDGGTIDADGTNITDGKASKQSVKDTLQKLAKEMSPSCTLTIFVTDHGTGYNTDQGYDGARPAFAGENETGITYPENTFKISAKKKTYRSTAGFVVNGSTWFAAKDESGKWSIYKREAGKWVYKGKDGDGNGYVTEDELGEDLNGDGDSSDAGFGLNLHVIEGRLGAQHYQNNEWDTDRDGNVDIRLRWDGTRYVFERLDGGTWKEMGRDTNGDFVIDGADGGVDWDLDGDKNDQVGFHEGINLWGKEVLWDDELAEMLKPLSDNGIHIVVEMVQCFSGGFVNNLEGLVEKVVTGASEDTKHYNRVDASGKVFAADEMAFLENLPGIDPESWNEAWDKAIAADKQEWIGEGSNPISENKPQKWENPLIATESTFSWEESEGGSIYTILLQLPQELEGKVYDFEIILGLQKPRWTVTLEGGLGFPELPAGMDSELIPGGIRAFSDEPIPISPLLIKLRGAGDGKNLRIDLTNQKHETIGYIKPGKTDPVHLSDVDAILSATLTPSCLVTGSGEACTGELWIICNIFDHSSSKTSIRRIAIRIDDKTEFAQNFGGEGEDPSPSMWNKTFKYKPVLCGTSYCVNLIVTNENGQQVITTQTVTCATGPASGGGGGVPCFADDTLVLMADGSTKQIRDIAVGDLVLAYDTDSGTLVTEPVIDTGNGVAETYYLLNGELEVTPPHPFFTTDGQWVRLADLAVGDQIVSPNGTTTISSIELVDSSLRIYNMSVDEVHNFFVSADGDEFFLAHEGY